MVSVYKDVLILSRKMTSHCFVMRLYEFTMFLQCLLRCMLLMVLAFAWSHLYIKVDLGSFDLEYLTRAVYVLRTDCVTNVLIFSK